MSVADDDEDHDDQHHSEARPAPTFNRRHLPAGLQITPASPSGSAQGMGSPSRKPSSGSTMTTDHQYHGGQQHHQTSHTAASTPGHSPPASAHATRHAKHHTGPLHDLKRFLNHHIGHHGDRPSGSRSGSFFHRDKSGSETPAIHPAVLAVARDGMATPGGGLSGVQTPGSQLRGGDFFTLAGGAGSTTNATNTPGNGTPVSATTTTVDSLGGFGSVVASPTQSSVNLPGSPSPVQHNGNPQQQQQQQQQQHNGHSYSVKDHQRPGSLPKTRDHHSTHTNNLVGFLKHHNRDHDKSSSSLASFFGGSSADKEEKARLKEEKKRSEREAKEREQHARLEKERERVAAKAEREKEKSAHNSPLPTPVPSRGASTLVSPSIATPSGATTPVGPGHFPEPSALEATQAHMSKKYGKWGRVLGSGAGGTVRLVKASSKTGGTTYAVKEFRPKRSGEDAKDYQRKVMAEFCVGVTLKHINVIETVDILNDHGHFFEVSLEPLESTHRKRRR